MLRISHCLSYFWGVTFFTVLFPCLARGGTHVGLSCPYKDGLDSGWKGTICCCKMFFPLLLLLFSSALAAWHPDAPPGYQLIYKKTLTPALPGLKNPTSCPRMNWQHQNLSPVQRARHVNNRGILVILVMLQVWLEKNWKQWSVCFGCISDMGLHSLKWEK